MCAHSTYAAALRALTSKLLSSNVPVVVVDRGKSEESANAAAMTSKENDDGKEDDNNDDSDGGGRWRRIAEVGGGDPFDGAHRCGKHAGPGIAV